MVDFTSECWPPSPRYFLPHSMMSAMERRRGGRIDARFWVELSGIDSAPELRKGNLSPTGIYLECDRPLGEPGAVHTMQLATVDHQVSLKALVRVARSVTRPNVWQGVRLEGVGFEFLLAEEAERSQLEQLLRHVVKLQLQKMDELRLDHRFCVHLAGPDGAKRQAVVHHMTARGITLETHWPLSPGSTVCFEIELTAGQPLPIEAEVAEFRHVEGPSGPCFQTELLLRNARLPSSEPLVGPSIAGAIEVLLEESLFHLPANCSSPPKDQLRGSLAHIQLPSLLVFLDLERHSGVITVMQGGRTAQLFLREGQIIDADRVTGPREKARHPSEAPGHDGPRALLREVFHWNEGEFEFAVGPVARADRLQVGTRALLLDLAREIDEHGR